MNGLKIISRVTVAATLLLASVAYGDVTATDNFNRANQSNWGTLSGGGGDWPTAASTSILSNTGRCNTVRTRLRCPVNLTSDVQDVSILNSNVTSGSYEIGVLLQYDASADSGWGVIMQAGQYRVYEITTGTATLKFPTGTITELTSTLPTTGLTFSASITENGMGNDQIDVTFGTDTYSYEITTNPHAGNTYCGVWVRGCDIDDFSATGTSVDNVAITYPVTHQVMQRDDWSIDGAGSATFTMTGTYVGTPTEIEYRWDGGAWATLDSSPSGNTFSEEVTLDVGQGNLEVRFANDTGITSSQANGVGDVYLIIGQSNAVTLIDTDEGVGAFYISPSEGYTASFCEHDGVWATYDNTGHIFSATDESSTTTHHDAYGALATQLMEGHGVPVGFVTAGAGSRGLHGHPDEVGGFGNHFTKAGTPGSLGGSNEAAAFTWIVEVLHEDANPHFIKAILWDQWQRDATCGADGRRADADDYIAAQEYLLSNLRTGCPAITSSTVMIAAGTATYNGTNASDADINAMDAAKVRGWDSSGIYPGPTGYDRDFSNDSFNGHWSTAGDCVQLSGMWYCAIEAAQHNGESVRGPKIVAGSIVDDDISLTFDRTIQDPGMSGWDPTILIVKDDGTPVTVSSFTYVDSRHATAALASTPAGAVTIQLFNANDAHDSVDALKGVVPRGSNHILPTTLNSQSTVSWPAERMAETTLPFVSTNSYLRLIRDFAPLGSLSP